MKNNIILMLAAIGVLSSLAACNGSDTDSVSTVTAIVVEPKPDTNGSVQTISADVNALSLPAVANIKFNDIGDAMAVWAEQTGIGIIANYSVKLASANQWSVPNIIYEQHSNRNTLQEFQAKTSFETEGSDFAISWIDGDNVYAKTFSPATGMLWTEKLILNDNRPNNATLIPHVEIASINGSILVVWFQDTILYGREYTSSGWQTTSERIFDLTTLLPNMTLSFVENFYLNASSNQYSVFGYISGWDNSTDASPQVQVFSITRGALGPTLWGNAKILPRQ